MPAQYTHIRDYYHLKKGMSLKHAKTLAAKTYNSLNPKNPLHGAELKKGHAKSGGKSAHSAEPKVAPAHEPDIMQDDTIGPQNRWVEANFSKAELKQIESDYTEFRNKHGEAHAYIPKEGEYNYPLVKEE